MGFWQVTWDEVSKMNPRIRFHIRIELHDEMIYGDIVAIQPNSDHYYLIIDNALVKKDSIWKKTQRILWIVDDKKKPIFQSSDGYFEYRAEEGYENGFIFEAGKGEIDYLKIVEENHLDND